MYVKTDGPVPDGINLIVGKLYEVEDVTKLTFLVVDEDGFGIRTCINKPCTATMCNIPWTFCDSTGTPVPAPWESENCSVCGGDGKETCGNPDHGFIYAMPGEVSRLGCPVCAGSPGFKVPNGGDCEHCSGSGKEPVADSKLRDLLMYPEPEPAPIDYRAHAERLAEALADMIELRDLTMRAQVNPDKPEMEVVSRAKALTSAYNQTKGKA